MYVQIEVENQPHDVHKCFDVDRECAFANNSGEPEYTNKLEEAKRPQRLDRAERKSAQQRKRIEVKSGHLHIAEADLVRIKCLPSVRQQNRGEEHQHKVYIE